MGSMQKINYVIPLVLTLAACGGGSGTDSTSTGTTSSEISLTSTPVSTSDVASTPVSTPEITPTGNVTPIVEPEIDTIASSICTSTSSLSITASDDGNFDADFIPGNILDGDTDDESRWSNNGIGQELILDYGETITATNVAILWYRANVRNATFSIETSTNNVDWVTVLESTTSTVNSKAYELYDLTPSNARYLKLIGEGNSDNDFNSIIELVTNQCSDISELSDAIIDEVVAEEDSSTIPVFIKPEFGDDGILHNIELIDWYLNTPEADPEDNLSIRIDEDDLANGYEDDEFYFPSPDGGLVFRSTVAGAKTSENTSFARSELREMLRRGDRSIRTQGINANNWVFGSANNEQQNDARGVDGRLAATLAVNYVTTTGSDGQVGRVIIGQIHANDDEPIRLYYRKLPGNSKGSIYYAHELRDLPNTSSSDVLVDMIGSNGRSASDPADGIALDERFSYIIDVVNDDLTVTISRDGKDDIVSTYDMSASRYYGASSLLVDDEEQYMYFKAGVYNQNNTGLDHDYVQATFYEIKNAHTNYEFSE